MITPGQADSIRNHAYVPEQLIGYGEAISGGEPFLLDDFLAYVSPGTLIFIGYPLEGSFQEEKMDRILESAIERFRPAQVALVAPRITRRQGTRHPSDSYFRLDLKNLKIPSKVRNMIQRASRDLEVQVEREITSEHQELISQFLQSHPVDPAMRALFEKIPRYVSQVPSAQLFNARSHDGALCGFDVADFGGAHYAFYMFNFRSSRRPVPGVSDLLLNAIVQKALRQEKSYLNLGLGIGPGVSFFKKKWGGQIFLNYEAVCFDPRPPSLWSTILKGAFPS